MKNLLRMLLLFCLFVLTNMLSSVAIAYPLCIKPYQMSVTPPPTVTYNANAPIGTVIFSKAVTSTLINFTPYPGLDGQQCAAQQTFGEDFKGTGAYLGNSLYATGIDGIAMRISLDKNVYVFPYTESPTYHMDGGGVILGMYIELIKTSAVSGSGSMSGQFALAKVIPGGTETYETWEWSKSFTVRPNTPTCTVSTPAVNVELGTIPAKNFSGLNSTAGGTPFTLSLSCAGGDSGITSSISLTLTDSSTPSNTTNTLTLSSSSSASGVGIQILSGSTVLKYGSGNTWRAGSSGNGTFNIPLTGRYIQTAQTVKPGAVKGLATFTMVYQ